MRAEAEAKGTLHSTPQENGHDAKPGRPDGDQHRAGQPGYVVRAELQSRIHLGTAGVGVLPAASLPRHRYGLGLVPGHRHWVFISADGADGAGAAGDGAPTGTAAIFSSTIPSFTVTVSVTVSGAMDLGPFRVGAQSRAPAGRAVRQSRSGGPVCAQWRLPAKAPEQLGRGEGNLVAERCSRRAEQRFGSPGFEQRGYTDNHSVFGGYHNGGMSRMQSDRGFSSMGAGRTLRWIRRRRRSVHGGGGGRR